MQPTRQPPITTIVRIDEQPDPRTVESTNAATRASAPQERVVATTPADPPSLTPGLARALGRIIAKAAPGAEIVRIADATDGHAIAS